MSDPATVIPRLYTALETAQALRVSARTVWTLTQRGLLRAVRIGKLVRYTQDDVQAFIEASKQGVER
jgi:excisionase family DNA binding protein